MIKDALKRLIKSSKKNTGILLINIFGLATGLAVFLLISMWIQHETKFDIFDGSENIYRLSFGNSTYLTAGEGPYFAENCLEIKEIVRFKTFGSALFTYEDKTYKVKNLRMADSTVFKLFPIDLIQGNIKTALIAPGNIVISETISETLFGDEDPIGKSINVNGGFDAVVSGVMKDIDHTFKPIDVLGSFVTLRLFNEEPDILESLRTNQYQTYFLLEENVSIEALKEKIHNLNIELFSIDNPEFENTIELINIKDLYFHPVHGPVEVHGNRTLVMIFLAISILTLFIACINFINLTIAKSSDSAVEVGIRKVSGATRSKLFNSFILESVILVLISAALAVLLLILFLPGFSNLIGVTIIISEYIKVKYVIGFFMLILLIGLLAGIIPASRMSTFDPLVYLRKISKGGKPSTTFRTVLVVFQFTVSTILVISVFAVSRQMNYVKDYNLGFQKDNVLKVNFVGEIGDKRDLFTERLENIPGVDDISYSGSAFGGTNFEVFYYEDERYLTQFLTVEPGFIETMKIDLISGRNFSVDRPADRLNTCILNEAAAELLGINPMDAPGKIITRRDWYLTTIPSERLEILGVVRDFNISSLRDTIPPYLICWGNWFSSFNIRIAENNQQQTLRNIEEVWTELNPAIPFEYNYFDDLISDQYGNEARLTKILIYFSMLALVIASFGLLGLSALSVQSRTQEIGIKKVHGATRLNIIVEVASGFVKWIAFALLIGTPVSIILMRRWLSGFAYHTTISAKLIFMSWIVLLLISLLTVLYHTIKISDTNPAESLKYE